MQAIPIDEVLERPTVLVDYFIRLAPNKYVWVARAGQRTPVENLNGYKVKAVTSLWVKLNDYQKVIFSSIQAAELIASTKSIPVESRLKILEDAMSSVYREFNDIGFNDQIYSHAKMVNHVTLSFIEQSQSLSKLITQMNAVQEKAVKHAMMVSMVSSMLGSGHDWVKPATLEKLSLGGFLHDIGKIKVPEAVLSQHRTRLNKDDRILYEAHAEIGRQLVLQAKSVPDDVALIVYEHHELSDGSGFPRGLKDFQISPLARVVALANAFVHELTSQSAPLSPAIVLRTANDLKRLRAEQFNKDALRAMDRMLTQDLFQVAG